MMQPQIHAYYVWLSRSARLLVSLCLELWLAASPVQAATITVTKTNQPQFFSRPRHQGLLGGVTLAVTRRFTPASMRTAHKTWGCLALVLLWVLTILLGPGQPAAMASPLPKPVADGSSPLRGSLAASARLIAAWGSSTYGQTTTPPDLLDVISVAVGDNHNLVLKKDGTVVAWGANDYGVLNVPSGLTNVIAIDAGNNHNLVLKGDGTVVAWGNNGSGQSTVLTGLSRVKAIAAIAAGGAHSLALKDDGTVVAWGKTGRSSLGEITMLVRPSFHLPRTVRSPLPPVTTLVSPSR